MLASKLQPQPLGTSTVHAGHRLSRHAPTRPRALDTRDVRVSSTWYPPKTEVSPAEISTDGEIPFEAIDSMGYETSASESVEEPNPYSSIDALSAPHEGAGGEPELESLLAEQGSDLSIDRICKIFSFELDGFQRKSVQKFLEGNSVVVCAPTGAGKTAIAEAAAAATLARGQRVIYTTPLKALSNQKLQETRKRFGFNRCGLQTGDTSLNTEAAIVVMTTEILRNIMYRSAETSEASGGPSTREARLGDVGLIVMDEVHYLGDPHRGSVWEEAIINCPRHIQLLCMSATVKNPDDLGNWISKEHQQCVTIKTRFRPVPLHWLFAYRRGRGSAILADLMDEEGKRINPRISKQSVMTQEARYMLARNQDVPMTRKEEALELGRTVQSLLSEESFAAKRIVQNRVPNLEQVMLSLRSEGMLPAIWFILSRRECDLNAIKAGLITTLNTPEEQKEVQKEIQALRDDQPDAIREKFVDALIAGFAAHHAGCLPGWKSLVEKLFQRGLIKIVFATGTLAAGINMPARTTLISALSRKTDDGIKSLPHNELLQMAGRAGRRGYDTEGNCIVLQNKFEGADEAVNIIMNGPEPLVSHFSASYGLVLNLLSVYTLDAAREFVSRSFGTYLQSEGNERKLAEIKQLEDRAKELIADFRKTATVKIKDLNVALKSERVTLKALKEEALTQRMAAAQHALASQGLPRKVVLNLTKPDSPKPVMVPAVILSECTAPEARPVGKEEEEEASSEGAMKGVFYACLGADNRLMRVSVMHVEGVLDGEVGSLPSEEVAKAQLALDAVRPNAWQNYSGTLTSCQVYPGTATTAVIALQLQTKHKWRRIEVDQQIAAKITQQRDRVSRAVAALEMQRNAAPEGGAGNKQDRASMDKMVQAKRNLKRAERLREELDGVMEGTWKTFTDVINILVNANALQSGDLSLLPLGLLTRGLQCENELWMALAMTHPSFIDLTGPELAGVLGALLSAQIMKRPGNIDAAYSASPKVVQVLEQLEPVRESLIALQTDSNLSRWNESLVVDLRLAGVVEAWAAGATWQQVMTDCGLEDGDIARLLIRVSDMLHQVQYNTKSLPYLKEAASEALRGVDRKPVVDLTVFG